MKMETERVKLIMEIFALAYLVHDQTDYCVFINFSGHVDSFEIDIRESAENYQNKVCETQFKDRFLKLYHKDKEDHLNWLKSTRDVLKTILEDGEIPYHEMTEEIEQTISYIF